MSHFRDLCCQNNSRVPPTSPSASFMCLSHARRKDSEGNLLETLWTKLEDPKSHGGSSISSVWIRVRAAVCLDSRRKTCICSVQLLCHNEQWHPYFTIHLVYKEMQPKVQAAKANNILSLINTFSLVPNLRTTLELEMCPYYPFTINSWNVIKTHLIF